MIPAALGSPEAEAFVVRFARENAGALAPMGQRVISDQMVGYILRRYEIAPAPEWSRTTTGKDAIRSHRDVLAGAGFFTIEVLT